MTNKSLINLLAASLAICLLSGVRAGAQSPYFQAVSNLHPVGYWPMHETTAPAPGGVEANQGSLGHLADGYYSQWNAAVATSPQYTNQVPGALANDADTAVDFKGSSTGYVLVPQSARATSLQPPFTLECWAKPLVGGTRNGDIISTRGMDYLTGGNANGNVGIGLYWEQQQVFKVFIGIDTAQPAISSSAGNALNQWHHLAVTCDAARNFTLYVDGSPVGTSTQPNYTPAPWNPFLIGAGLWFATGPQRTFPGGIDEVAVYTNDLSFTDITTHYTAGVSGAAGQYRASVMANNPAIYLRMNAPTYVMPDVSSWPVVTNYGAVSGNGVYTPGTMPGIVPPPANAAGVPFGGLSGGRVAQLNGMSTYADVGYAAEYDPVGAVPFSVTAIARGNPADQRRQMIVGHSDNSWRLWFGTGGQFLWQVGTNATAVTSQVQNDGKWHHVVAVYTPAADPNVTGTNAIYVDGVLEAVSAAVSTNGINPGTNLNVMIGADPQYTNNPAGFGRQLAGQVCEVALFTNALSADQVAALYAAAGVAPTIKIQPVSAAVNQNSTFTNTVVVSGSQPLSYQWYQDGAPKSGQTGASLVLDSAQPADAGSYFVVATNNYGAVTSVVCQLTVIVKPSILAQLPLTYTNLYTLYVGASPTFTLSSVSGAAPLSFQWFTNGVADVSGTNARYQLHNLQAGWITNYCVVTNLAGSATSFTWAAAVVPAPAAPYPQSVLGLNPLGYWRLNEADNAAFNGNPGAIAHDYLGGNDGLYTNVNLGQQGYSLGLANQYGNPASATDPTTTSAQFGTFATTDSGALSVAGVDFATPTNRSASFSISAWVNGSSSQVSGAGLVTKGYGNGGEQFNLDVFGKAFRFLVRDAAGAVHTAASTNQLDSYWHHVVGVCDEPNGAVSLYVDGVLVAQGSIIPGSGILSSTNLMSIGARKSNGTTNAYDLAFAGYLNDVAVYGYALNAAQVASNYLAAGIAPRITQQPPATVTVAEGGTLTLTAAALGSSPLSLLWQAFNNPLLVAGQTNATLVLSNVPTSLNFDSLYLTATNLYGAAVSANTAVTVISGPPQITASNLPAQLLLPLGKSYTYSVDALGTLPLSYQWSKGGAPVAGETKSSYTVIGDGLGSSTVSVVINNTRGSAGGSSLLTVIPMVADSYSTEVLALQPVGYWPLQETSAPAPVTLETNYGTLGAVGNAYYASANVNFAQSGALADGDASAATTGAATSYAFVPRKVSDLTLRPPLTLECWMKPTGGSGTSDLISQGGSGLNSAANAGDFGGFRISFGGGSGDGDTLQFFAYIGTGGTYNGGGTNIQTAAGSILRNQWNYCVASYDGTDVMLYINGQLRASGSTPFALDTWTPLTIGGGRWQGQSPTRRFTGALDEVAVYTNVLSLSQIQAHYSAATTGSYKQTILDDHPQLYYRMDAAGFVTPSPALYPTAVNYGSASPNGAYAGGIVPGGVAGPPFAGAVTSLAAPINGLISCVDAGYDAAFDPTNQQPLTAVAWFRTYPSDGRVQTLMSHGANWALNLDGTTGRLVWNLYSGGQVTSTGILNDGDWHMVAGVSDGITSSLYVDGALDAASPLAAGLASDPGSNLFLGGNADYTTVGNDQRYFAGAISQAAFFTNALTSGQVHKLYNVATSLPVPAISLQTVGDNLVITYTGTLVSSTNVAGQYDPVIGATRPTYTVPKTDAQRFYRSRNP